MVLYAGARTCAAGKAGASATARGVSGAGRFPHRVSIETHPGIVARKARVGDWEGDILIGACRQALGAWTQRTAQRDSSASTSRRSPALPRLPPHGCAASWSGSTTGHGSPWTIEHKRKCYWQRLGERVLHFGFESALSFATAVRWIATNLTIDPCHFGYRQIGTGRGWAIRWGSLFIPSLERL